jgi:hypothetical protein
MASVSVPTNAAAANVRMTMGAAWGNTADNTVMPAANTAPTQPGAQPGEPLLERGAQASPGRAVASYPVSARGRRRRGQRYEDLVGYALAVVAGGALA